MKLFKRIIVLFFLLVLVGCNDLTLSTEGNSTKYVTFIGETTEYKIGDSIPDWNTLFEVSDTVASYTILTDLQQGQRFTTLGEFSIVFQLQLESKDQVFESFKITVTASGDDDSELVVALSSLFDQYSEPEYYSYDTDMSLSFSDGSNAMSFSISSTYEVYMNRVTYENMFHFTSLYSIDVLSQSDTFTSDMYFYVDQDNGYFAMTDGATPWEFSTIPMDEMNDVVDSDSIYNISDLCKGAENIVFESTDSGYSVSIPISSDNFSIDMFSDIDSMIQLSGLEGIIDPFTLENMMPTIAQSISLTAEVNSTFTELYSLSFDLTDFYNIILVTAMGTLDDGEFTDVTLVISNFSTEVIEFDPPFIEIEYAETGINTINVNGTINDAYIDTTNHIVVYSISGDNYLYIYNYITQEQKQLYFNIKPDQITGNDDYIYVTLSDGHQYYNDEAEYGGLGVIKIDTLSKENEFSLNFDPYDIVVDKDEFVYISPGSNQHGNVRGVNPYTGEIVSSTWGFYYLGQLMYSEYSDHMYYVEIKTTSDYLEVMDVNRGVLGTHVNGDEGFVEKNLTLSPDGKYIYSLDGKIFALNTNISSDGKITKNLGFSFQAVAFNNEITYFAKDDGIYATDSSGVVNTVYQYSGKSFRLGYDSNNILINVGTDKIEILDLNGTSNSMTIITTLSYSDEYIPDEILIQYDLDNYGATYVSGEVNTFVLGQYEINYTLESGDQTIDLTIIVNVVDIDAPSISLPDDTAFKISVGDEFIVPSCIVTDNYDSSPVCIPYEYNVDPNKLGTYYIIYRAEDSFGNVSLRTYNFEVTLKSINYNISTTSITGAIADAVYSETYNAIFYTLPDFHQVVKYDIATGITTSISFTYKPELVLLQDDVLYVTIIHQAHSSGWYDENQTGEIAIINPATFELVSTNQIKVDPYQIAVIDGYIYIFPGSGQWANIWVYPLNDFTQGKILASARQKCIIAYNPSMDYIYYITSDLSPQSLKRVEFSDMNVLSVADDPGHGDYKYGNEIFVSHDSLYVFSSYGQAFFALKPSSGLLLDHAFDLNFTMTSYLYDSQNDVNLYGDQSGYVKISSVGSYEAAFEVKVNYRVDDLYGTKDTFYVLSFTSTGITLLTATLIAE